MALDRLSDLRAVSRLAALVIRLHQRYCTTNAVRVVWILLVVISVLQVVVAGLATAK